MARGRAIRRRCRATDGARTDEDDTVVPGEIDERAGRASVDELTDPADDGDERDGGPDGRRFDELLDARVENADLQLDRKARGDEHHEERDRRPDAGENGDFVRFEESAHGLFYEEREKLVDELAAFAG